MSGVKFFRFLGIVFLIALIVYYLTTPRGKDIPLIGVVDGNEVIVSPQITGRIIALNVDEGSEVKKGDLIAQLDPKELQAQLAAAKANVDTLEASVHEAQHNYTWTNDQTGASIEQAGATVTSTNAQLDQARAQLWRDQNDLDRMEKLFAKGEISAQDRDHAEAAVRMSQANVQALQQSVKAQQGGLAVAQANRKQIDVRKSALATAIAQLEQARANETATATQLGYTQIYSPINGIVSVRVAKQGEVIAQGSPIVVVVDVDHLWVQADVEETYIDLIQFGQKMRVQLPSGDTLEGQVFFKGVEGDYATQRDVSRTKRDIKTFEIKVSVPNPGRRLFTGMTATVLLPPPEKKSWFARL
ncbi:MAG TPA: efflux RND transporter periplasmic adaptor subunit [Candidatus Acidoferrum sp.]|nr:efflux RND transporter periplasmic adaptor subunit [Candidatus Acidoferrum sp.]